MNIIFIAEYGHYKNWGPKNYFDLFNYVKEHNEKNNIYLYFSSNSSLELEKEMKKINANIVLFFDTTTFSESLEKFNFVFNWKIPIGLVLLDMFYPSKIVNNKYVKKMNFLIHFGKSMKIIDYYQKLFPGKLITFLKSRFINKQRFQDYKLKKEYDIIFYGTRRYYYDFKSENIDFVNDYIKKWEKHYNKKIPKEINFYPLRERLENLLKNNNKYKILFLPEKNSYESEIKNEELSKLLNKSYMAVACSTIADICMHKYFEIIGSHCMVLGDVPSDFQKLLKGKICEVNEFMNDEEIIEKIELFLLDKKKLIKDTDELYEAMHKEHGYREAVKNFNVIFEKILEHYKS